MAGLRDNLFNVDNNLTPLQAEQLEAAGMGSLRRAFTSGRITNEINPLQAEIAGLEADGTPEALSRARGLRDQVTGLQQRQRAYAPEVGRVENINGIGSGLTWVGEQVGQGAASMMDPIAVSAGLTGAGRVVGAAPHPIAKAASLALQGGGVLAPYLMSQRQLMGEAYGSMVEDPDLMSRTSAQERYETARNYGLAAAIPDSAIPGLIGRQLTGGFGGALRHAAMGPVAKTGLGTLVEGGTELGQEMGKQYALGQLNPARDTSGDASDRLNSFLGGAVGGAGPVALGAYTEAGYSRVGDTAEKVGTRAGQVVDMAAAAAQPTIAKGRGWIAKGREAAGEGVGSLTDENGRIDLSKVVAAGREAVGRPVFDLTPEDREILGSSNDIPAELLDDPDPAKATAWLAQRDTARRERVYDGLSQMDDPAAQALRERIENAPDLGSQALAVDEGASYLLDLSERSALGAQATKAARAAGGWAATAGNVAGRIGKGAAGFAKDLAKDVVEGARGKKNLQTSPYDAWLQRREDSRVAADSLTAGVQGEVEGARTGPARPAQPKAPIDPAAVERSRRRAELFGELLAAQAAEKGVLRGSREAEAAPQLMRDMGYELADIAERWNVPVRRQAPGVVMALDRIANNLRVAFGQDAEKTLTDLEGIQPGLKPLIDHVRQTIAESRTKEGRQRLADQRRTVAATLLSRLPTEQAAQIVRGNQQMELLERVEDFANGYADPRQRANLEKALGKETLAQMIADVSGLGDQPQRGETVDAADTGERAVGLSDEAPDATETGAMTAAEQEISDFDRRMAEKSLRNGRGPAVYGVAKSPVLREDPFAPNERMTKAQRDEFALNESARRAEGLDPLIEPEFQRPHLFKKGEKLHDGSDAIESRRGQLERSLDVGHTVSERSAREVMDGLKMPLARRLAIYRDYLRQDKDAEGADRVHQALLDAVDGHDFGPNENQAGDLTEEQVQPSGMKRKTDVEMALEDYFERHGIKPAAAKPEVRLSAQERYRMLDDMKGLTSQELDRALAAYNARRASAAESAPSSAPRLKRKERNQLLNEMNRYFEERFLVVGERADSRDPMRIGLTEVQRFIDQGKRAESAARTKEDPDAYIDGLNLLVFRSPLADKKTGKVGEVPIKANDLVAWVRRQRESMETATRPKKSPNANEQFLRDLSEGITTLLSSGYVDPVADGGRLAYKLNAKGEKQWLTETSMPASLRLATTTYGGMMFGKDKKTQGPALQPAVFGPPVPLNAKPVAMGPQTAVVRAAQGKDARLDEIAQDDVRDDQGKGAEPFVPDDSPPESEAMGAPVWSHALTVQERAVMARLDSLAKKMQYAQAIAKRLDLESPGAGNEFLESFALTGMRGAAFNPDARGRRLNGKPSTDDLDTTPLDFFDELEAPSVPDEFADQQFMTRNAGASAYDPLPTETKMSAWNERGRRADALLEKFRRNFGEGLAEVEMRLRSAQRPEYDPGGGAVGGFHYALPLARVLNPDTIGQMDATGTDARRLAEARATLARLIADAKMTNEQRVALAREMAPAESRTAVTVANVKRLLEKAAEGAAPKQTALQRAQAEESNRSRTVPETKLDQFLAAGNFDRLTTPELTDRFLQAAYKRWGELRGDVDLTPTQEKAYAQLGGMFSPGSMEDLASYYPDAGPGNPRTDDAIRAMLAGSEVPAQAPKSQPRPGGAPERVAQSRIGGVADDVIDQLVGGRTAALDAALSDVVRAWRRDATFGDAMQLPSVRAAIAELTADMMLGDPGAKRQLHRLQGWIMQVFATPRDAELEIKIEANLAVGGEPLSRYMDLIVTSSLPEGLKAVARAVKKVAGTTPVESKTMNPNVGGRFDQLAGTIAINPAGDTGKAHTALHEGVHAATVRALVMDAELHQAAYNLMAHVAKHDPALAKSYGMTNTLEFFAEGLSNIEFQRRLYKVPASAVVEKYLGQTLANAWDAFVAIVRKALNLPAQHASALTQLLDLSGRAMKSVAFSGDASVSVQAVRAMMDRPMVPSEAIMKIVKRLKTLGEVGDLSASLNQDMSHLHALAAAILERIASREVQRLKRKLTEDDLNALAHDINDVVLPSLGPRSLPNMIGGRTLNSQDSRFPGGRVATDAEIQQAKDYLKRVLGDQVRSSFEKLTGYSGEWIEADNVIQISTTAAAGTLQTAYHEALHAFFSKFVKNNPAAFSILRSLAENEQIVERVHALLHGYPAAQAQLVDGEERLAYIYQFWAAGLLKLGPGKPRTLLQKIGRFFREVFGAVKDSERAVDLLEAFHAGKMADPSAAGRVIAAATQAHWSAKARRKFDGLVQLVAAATMPSEMVLANSASPRAQALAKMFFSNPGDEAAGPAGEGYLNARTRESKKYHNLLAQAVDGLNDQDLEAVTDLLQRAVEPTINNIPYRPHREAVVKIRQALDRFYQYMSEERGLKVGYIERYYPVIWSLDTLMEKKVEFIDMLTTHYKDELAGGVASARRPMTEQEVAERIWQAIVDKKGGDNQITPNRDDGVLVPFFESGEHRVLNWIKPEHRAPFLEKNLIAQLSRYFHEGARAAEYASRFGEKGERLAQLLDRHQNEYTQDEWDRLTAKGMPPGYVSHTVTPNRDGTMNYAVMYAGDIERELMGAAQQMAARGELADKPAQSKWVARQMRDVRHSVGAMEGTLGKDISPAWRKFNSWMTVYQNMRLLPLALFSSIVDPLGMVARGAELKDAYAAFTTGLREVMRTWANTFRDEPVARQKDKWADLAEFVGATEAEIFAHHVSDEYSSIYMSPAAKALNDKLFVFNGMEAWNRSMRIAATKAAVQFIVKHKALPDKTHSARWLQELGLKPEDIVLNADGELVVDRHELAALKNIPLEQATERIRGIHWAINRWVEGAILTPNAAQRPSWSSDPRWGIFFHLKQFTYSFHQTLVKRAVNEANHGNLAPLGAFAWYIPMMIASDITKGLIQGGGELPAYMKGYDAGDWLLHGAQRAGVLGIGQVGVDAGADVASLGGPAVEQAIDALRDPLEHSTVKALPLQPIYREWLK